MKKEIKLELAIIAALILFLGFVTIAFFPHTADPILELVRSFLAVFSFAVSGALFALST